MDALDTIQNASTAAFVRNDSWISSDSAVFRGNLNRESFQFTHKLVGHPLFELPRLARLAEKVLKSQRQGSYVLSKVADSVPNIGRQWENFTSTERVGHAIEHIRECGTWIMVAGAQIDPDYQALLNSLLAEIEALCGVDVVREMTWVDAMVFIGSPNSVTHYHLDTEANFLFQVHGTKEAHIFDARDPAVLTDDALEDFYIAAKNDVSFKPEYEEKAKVYDFKSGTGVHIPVNFPHWVKNLDDYSITFSVLFYLRSMDHRARVYQVNHWIRKLGLTPTPPGVSQRRDWWKSRLANALTVSSPKTKDELLRSGVRRLTLPFRAYNKLMTYIK